MCLFYALYHCTLTKPVFAQYKLAAFHAPEPDDLEAMDAQMLKDPLIMNGDNKNL